MSVEQFRDLISWSSEQFSSLPWRKKRSLYKTLVSEIMLQQTTVGTVMNHFDRFLNEYPTIFDLAKSTEEEICISWKGLGYYRRARNLRNISIAIVEKYKGKIPENLEELQSLKGIGPYTANALVAIGADKKALAVDANLERVLSRYYGISIEKGPKLQKEIWSQFADATILNEMDSLSARDLNEALMDLGRILCQANKATCMICPLSKKCKAYKTSNPLSFPVVTKEKKPSAEHVLKLLRVVVTNEEGEIVVYQKNNKEWLSGQWELPTLILECDDKKLIQYPQIKMQKEFTELPKVKTSITKYAIENYYIEMSLKKFEKLVSGVDVEYEFKRNDKKLNLSTASLKILKAIG